MKVFLVRVEYDYDYVVKTEEDVFSSYEKAKEVFDKCVKDEKYYSHLMKRENRKIEQSENHFALWDDGKYNQDHCCIDILEKQVK